MRNHPRIPLAALALTGIAAFALSGCKSDSNLESAGKDVDKGLERSGENLEAGFDKIRDDIEDAFKKDE